tara:strand:- start:6927 stop:7367 length:441 start_codon:yes stop_codon:yes gene_type:complete
LHSGDYTLIDSDGSLLDHLIVIERKSLDDFVACCGRERARFERELQRLAEECMYPFVFVEGSYDEVGKQNYSSTLIPRQIIGSVYAFAIDYGVHIQFVSSHDHAAAAARRLFLVIEARIDRGDIKVGSKECVIRPRELTFSTRYGA